MLRNEGNDREAQECLPGYLSPDKAPPPPAHIQPGPKAKGGDKMEDALGRIPTTGLGLANPGAFAVAPEPYSTSDFKDSA